MLESFLHYIWQYQLFDTNNLKLVSGQTIEILNPGNLNNDAGPDFFNARVKIDNTIWAGNIEIHQKTSQWFEHKHNLDPNYQNIILHVAVKNNTTNITGINGNIPLLLIEPPKNLYNQYTYLINNNAWIPCESFINKVDKFIILQWKEALLVERLTQKAEIIEQRFKQTNNNFEDTFYITLAHNFGFKTNSLPFELLAKSIELKHLAQNKDNIQIIEALLYGQAGLIPENPKTEYETQLQKNYAHYKLKYNLNNLSGQLWKFSKIRPVNYPTIRISQFASLIHRSSALMSKVLESRTIEQLENLFKVEATGYWLNHYTFKTETYISNKPLGKNAFTNIVINTIAPFMFFYSKIKDNNTYTRQALEWLTCLPPESNHIITEWKKYGIEIQNAFDTQALTQLKNNYCQYRKCLNCRIGNQVIKQVF